MSDSRDSAGDDVGPVEQERPLAVTDSDAEIAALTRLNELSERLWQAPSLAEGLEELLAAAMELLRADFGTVQFFDPARKVLLIAAQQGFSADFLESFREVWVEDESACGRTLKSGQRTIVEDIETDERYEPFRELARSVGYRSVQSTPLISRHGVPLGMISTHWKQPHAAPERDLRRLDILARQAAVVMERLRAEEELRQSESRAQRQLQEIDAIYTESPVGLVMIDLDFRYIRINEALASINGVSADQHIGRPVWEVVPEIADAGYEIFRKVIETRQPVRVQLPGSTPASPARVWDEHWYPLFDDNNQLIGVGAVVLDVTAQKRAEQALRDNEALLQSVLQQLPFGIGVIDAGANWLLSNPIMTELVPEAHALTRTDLEHRWQFLTEDGHALPPDRWPVPRALRDEQVIPGIDALYRSDDGHQRWMRVSANPLRRDGAVIGATCIVQDIDAVRRPQEEISRSRDSLLGLIEHCPFGIYIVDSHFRILTMNRRSLEGAYSGVQPVIGRPFEEVLRILWPQDVATEIVDIFRHTLETGEPFSSKDFMHMRADTARVESYEWEVHRISLPDGSLGVACYFFDSSELRRAEEALHRSESRVTETLESISDGFMAVDNEWRFTYVNAAAEGVVNLPRQEMLGRTWQEIFPLAVGTRLEDELRRCMQENVPVEVENFYAPWQRWFLCRAYPTPDGGFAQYFQEITERKRAAEALVQSEARYRALVENQEEMLCRFQSDGTILFVNSAYAHSRGTTADRLAGRNFWEFVAVEDRPAVQHMLDQLTRDTPLIQIENRFESVEGQRWTLWTNRALAFDSQGRWTEAQSSGFDITDRKRAEETIRTLLRISERLNSTLEVDALLDILVAEAINLVGAESGVAGLRTPAGLACKKYLQQGRELPLDYCWPPHHGLPGWLLVHQVPYLTNNAAQDPQIVQELVAEFGVRSALSTPIVTAQDEVIGFFEIHNKIHPNGFTKSDRDLLLSVSQVAAIAVQNALAYRTIQLAEESLKEADRRKDEFLATLAHELRNPLAPIRSGLEVMRIAKDDPAVIEEVRRTMVRQTEQLVRLIDDLMDVSRITRGKLKLQQRLVELKDIVRSAQEAVGPYFDERLHELVVDLPPAPVWIHVDPNRLAQVLSNLLHNAAKYSPKPGRIELKVQCSGMDVLLSVKDRGVGIPHDKLSTVFDMFAQLSPTAQGGYSGLGIGLTLAKSLIEMHGGSIRVLSDGEDLGTEVVVHIPGRVQAEGEGEQASVHDHKGTYRPKQRVLIVDDNRDAADMLSLTVKMLGNEVKVAHDGVEAVTVASEFRPDVILLDLGMPRMDGYEAAKHIRRSPAGAKTILVALTGWGQEEDKRRTREAGFDHHLVKPADPAALKEILSGL